MTQLQLQLCNGNATLIHLSHHMDWKAVCAHNGSQLGRLVVWNLPSQLCLRAKLLYRKASSTVKLQTITKMLKIVFLCLTLDLKKKNNNNNSTLSMLCSCSKSTDDTSNTLRKLYYDIMYCNIKITLSYLPTMPHWCKCRLHLADLLCLDWKVMNSTWLIKLSWSRF